MKKVIAISALLAFAGNAFAQLSSLPPSLTTDGVSLAPIGANAGASHWESPSTLNAYRFASDDNLGTPKPGTPDNALGLNWAGTSAQALARRSQINATGGSIRTIFLGESAGWKNDFGYTYSGSATSSSFTAWTDITASTNIKFGDHFDVSFGVGEAANFDFWLNGVGAMGAVTPPGPSEFGGVYTAFSGGNNVRWTINPILVNTWVAALDAFVDVPTFLVGFEDWRTDRGADRDYNDFMFAVQFYQPDGSPFTPVPEPSTYGLIGAAALLGLVMVRRFKARK